MAFRLGILAAIVAYRRRNGKTRLKTLRQSLKNKKEALKLYQYPVKTLFSILFLISLIVGLQWIKSQIRYDLQNEPIIDENLIALDPSTLNAYEEKEFFENATITHYKSIEVSEKVQQKFVRMVYVLKALYVFFVIGIASLIFSLKMKVVTALKQENLIVITKYKPITSEKEAIEVSQGDRLIITQMGESRITKTDYYFSVRLLGQKRSRHIIKKSCIYDARVAVIKLAHQLQIPFSTKIVKQNAKRGEEEDEQC